MWTEKQTILIRCYQPVDAESINELVSAHAALDTIYRPPEGESGDEWLAHGVGETLVRFVAVQKNRVVGHIAVGNIDQEMISHQKFREYFKNNVKEFGEIRRGIVHPDLRKTGLGGKLSKYALRWTVEHNLQPVAASLDHRVDSAAMLQHYRWEQIAEFDEPTWGKVLLWVPPKKIYEQTDAYSRKKEDKREKTQKAEKKSGNDPKKSQKKKDDQRIEVVVEREERKKAIQIGPKLKNIETAMDCLCGCHPQPARYNLHDGGATCPCQLSKKELKNKMKKWIDSLDEKMIVDESWKKEQEKEDEEIREEVKKYGAEIWEADGYAPFVVRGTVDGRAFYLRERHDIWRVSVAGDTNPDADIWYDVNAEKVDVASGESSIFCSEDKIFDRKKAVLLAVREVKRYLMQKKCHHPNASTYCPECGKEVVEI